MIYCRTKEEAERLLKQLEERFKQCKLELHPEKTRIVYCKDDGRNGVHPEIKFDFLGYTFRPRRSKNRYGKFFINFTPAVSNKACKAMRQTIREWRMHLKPDITIHDLSRMFNASIRGWLNYYGHFYKSQLYPVFRHMNLALVQWARRKYKKLERHKTRAIMKVYPEKTRIVDAMTESFKFLGHEFKPGGWVTPSTKAIKKFEERIREITRRNQTVNVEQLVRKKLNPYIRGWGNYFGRSDAKKLFSRWDAWIRRRLRMVQLRSWKKIRKLHREMRRRGWEGNELPRMRMTAWRSSQEPHVNFALPNAWFKEIGLCSLLDI